MPENGKTHFKNLAYQGVRNVFFGKFGPARFLKCV